MISRDSVNTKEEAYKLFEWSLLNFRKSISLSISNAYDLFTEYVKNNPRLGIYFRPGTACRRCPFRPQNCG